MLHPNPDISDKSEADIPDDDVVYTMVYDIMEAMEWENNNICNDYGPRYREEHKIDDNTYSMSDPLEK